MRWFWIDRFVEFDRGTRAVSIKNVSLSEEHIHDHFPGFPVMPASLIIEGMAQTGGILLSEATDFSRMVVLAKVPKFVFHGFAIPGDTLRYDVTMMQETSDGGIVDCKAYIGDQLLAEGEICFAFLETPASSDQAQQSMLSSAGLADILKIGQGSSRFVTA